jgi:hypothetical protein
MVGRRTVRQAARPFHTTEVNRCRSGIGYRQSDRLTSGTLDELCVESGLALVRRNPKDLFGRGQAGVGLGNRVITESLHTLR